MHTGRHYADDLLPSTDPDPLADEIAEMVANGRRGDAFIHFNKTIGVPEEMLAGMERSPVWPALETLAHTFVYHLRITGSFPVASLSAIATPTMVVVSQSSDESMREGASAVTDAMPNGRLREMPGEWHGVAPNILAPALTEFLLG